MLPEIFMLRAEARAREIERPRWVVPTWWTRIADLGRRVSTFYTSSLLYP